MYAPEVNADVIIAAGSTNMRQLVPLESLEGVLTAYAKSLDRVYFFACGMSAAGLIVVMFMGGVEVTGKLKEPKAQESVKKERD